jgi:hypothetical protein
MDFKISFCLDWRRIVTVTTGRRKPPQELFFEKRGIQAYFGP